MEQAVQWDQVDANDFNIYLKRNMKIIILMLKHLFQTRKKQMKDGEIIRLSRKGYAVALSFEYHPKVSPFILVVIWLIARG